MILFETTDSVIELLWDVALAFFIVRIALVYFFLNFTSGLLLSWLALSGYTPVTHLVALSSSEALVPFLLVSAVVWARVIVVRYEIPRAGWFRLGIGAVGLGLMVLAEVVVGWVVYEEGWWRGEVWGRLVGEEGRVWAVLAGVLGWYALMPYVMMWFEGVEEMRALEHEEGLEKRPVETEKN